MAEINLDDERKHCREFYEKWGFIKRIVELYAEGVSWKGCKVVAPAEPDKIPVQYSQIIDIDAIKAGLCDMLVDGIGDFKLKVLDSEQVLSIPMPREFPDEEAGRSFLWAAALNAKRLEEVVELSEHSTGTAEASETAGILVSNMCAVLSVPLWLLLPGAATTDPSQVMSVLSTFWGQVEELRNYIVFQIKEGVKPLISNAISFNGHIEVEWNENWLKHERIAEYGPVYQVFRAQGIQLSTVAENMLGQAKVLLDIRVISRDKYEELVKWFI